MITASRLAVANALWAQTMPRSSRMSGVKLAHRKILAFHVTRFDASDSSAGIRRRFWTQQHVARRGERAKSPFRPRCRQSRDACISCEYSPLRGLVLRRSQQEFEQTTVDKRRNSITAEWAERRPRRRRRRRQRSILARSLPSQKRRPLRGHNSLGVQNNSSKFWIFDPAHIALANHISHPRLCALSYFSTSAAFLLSPSLLFPPFHTFCAFATLLNRSTDCQTPTHANS